MGDGQWSCWLLVRIPGCSQPETWPLLETDLEIGHPDCPFMLLGVIWGLWVCLLGSVPCPGPRRTLGLLYRKASAGTEHQRKSGCLRQQAQLCKAGSEHLKGSFNSRRDRNHLASPPPNLLGHPERTGDGKYAQAFDSNQYLCLFPAPTVTAADQRALVP